MKNMHNKGPYFSSFRGNCFNIVFLYGGYVFHLANIITDFFANIHGMANGLLKAVHADTSVPVYIAGCRVLGTINKFLSAPLWRITESKGHILNMSDVYVKIDNMLSEITQVGKEQELVQFAKGEISCFDECHISKDEVYRHLIEEKTHDDIFIPMLRHNLLAIRHTLNRMTKDFLPGGSFYNMKHDNSTRAQTSTTPRHNKLPERIFRYLGFLMDMRPNSADLTNEAQVMFLLNKTSEFVNSKTKQELDKLITETRRDERKYREKAKQRQQEIHNLLVERQEKRKRDLEATRARALKKKEDLTSIIIDVGLWQNEEQLNRQMEECEDDKERYTACKNQIKFRRSVLQQYLKEDKGFNFTEKSGKPKHWTAMRDHLRKFINAALSCPTSKSCTKTPDNENITVPLRTGKQVHHTFNESHDISDTTYSGTVISQVPGFPSWYNIVYDDDPVVYSYKLVDDYNAGNLSIIVQV